MRYLTIIFCAVLVLFSLQQAQSTIIRVPADQPTIQAGINAAASGDTVLVARGHYYERINFYGKAILVASYFIFDNNTTTIDSTIIDANTDSLGVPDTGSVVCFVNGEDSSSVIKGFTIQNGTGTLDPYSIRYGGGIYCAPCSATITNNKIRDNSAYSGGGIGCLQHSSPIISNNTITGNSADWGGGIYCQDQSSPTIINNIIVNSLDGEGIACQNQSYPEISYNDVWNNADGNFYGCPAGVGDTTWGINFNITPCDSFYNIIRDPLFADTIDFGLLCNSPCIDAGDPSYYVPPDSAGCRIDVGAYEYPYMLGDANVDCGIDIVDAVIIIQYLFINGPPPCPYHAGDAICDEINIADLVYLINYLFVGGSPPGCP